MKKGLLIFLGVLLSISMILVACAPKEPPAKGEEPVVDEPVGEVVGSEPVTIQFLCIADDLQTHAMDLVVKRFHEIENGKYAHIKIEFDAKPSAEINKQLQTSVAAGVPLDIIQVDGPEVTHLAYQGLLKDLSADFTKEEIAQWVPQSVTEGSYKGGFYAPPMRQSCSLMWYNPELTDAAGIDVPNTLEEAWTYEEALEAWKKTTIDEDGDGVPEIYGIMLGQGPYWGVYEYGLTTRSAGEEGSPTFQSMSPDGITFDGYFNSDDAVATWEFVESLYQEHKVASTEPTWDVFFTGALAFNFYPDRILGQIKNQYPDAPIAAAPLPYIKTNICHTGSWHYAIAENTQHYAESLAFVKFAASDEAAEIYWNVYGALPPNVNLVNNLPAYQEYPRSLIADMFNAYGHPRPITPAFAEYNTLFVEFYQALINGTAAGDVKGLVDEYTAYIEEVAAKYAGWNE